MYTRREFGKMVAAGLPASLALAKINSQINGVRLGAQTYSFRDLPREGILDGIIKAMTEVGLGECELYSPHIEPGGPAGRPRPPRAAGGPPPDAPKKRPPESDPARMAAREELRKWRLTVPLDHFRKVRAKFEDAGISIYAFNLSFREDFTDEEIDRGFEMAKALGVKFITASSTIAAAKRVAPFADKHKMIVAMHGHSNVRDPNEFATPETFASAMAMSKYFWINLDIGHFFAAGYDPLDYIKKHHDRISNLHLKDRKKDDGPNMPWGQGDTPIKQVLQLLKAKKYPIPAFIEYEYRGEESPAAEVKKCFQYCKEALA